MPLESKLRLGETPLTDVRAISGSVIFHGLLILAASALALGVGLPRGGPEPPRALQGELDPVNNRAAEGDGGGAPGPLGAERLAEALKGLTPERASGASTESAPPSEALLAEILPGASASTEAVRQALPGPSTSVPGLLTGPGAGGGGGSGGGAGGGVGRGVGPGTEFFGARETATTFAYVIDCSGSMATRGSLDVAKRELLNSLNRLVPDARFAVIFYNLHATVFADPQGRTGLMPATAANKGWVARTLGRIIPDGGTNHLEALSAALAMKPEVVFFLTDADLMTDSDATTVLAEAGSTRIHAVEFGRGPELGSPHNPLRRLATTTGGAYRYIDVTTFPRGR